MNTKSRKPNDEMSVEVYLAIRKEEGLRIDPGTADVDWHYAQVIDPYGVRPDLPAECDCVGRTYFARRPGGKIWISFDDLPDATREGHWKKHSRKLAFLADIPLPFPWRPE